MNNKQKHFEKLAKEWEALEKGCQHYTWYNDEKGVMYCLKCNEKIGQLER